MRPICLKVLGTLALCFALTPAYAQEKDYRSVEALKSIGVNKCASAISAMTNFIYDRDDFAYLNAWHEASPDKHMSLTTTVKPHVDGTTIAAIAASPTANGTCDTHFVQVVVINESCPKLRDTAFKEWKYYADLGGSPTFEDPTSESTFATLASIQGGCLVVKTGIIFFAVEKQK
jgi:hypothetical protein